MTLIVTTVKAHRDETEFLVDGTWDGEAVVDMIHVIDMGFPAADAVCQAWLDAGNTTEIVDDAPSQEEIEQARRDERTARFEETLNIMNNLWYDSLTSTQQANLATWRQEWLDYPSTGVVPNETLVSDIF